MNRPVERSWTLAEAGGFEPPVREKAHGSLANCWFQPLTQTSKVGKQLTAFSKCGAKVILLFCSTKLLLNFFSLFHVFKPKQSWKLSHFPILIPLLHRMIDKNYHNDDAAGAARHNASSCHATRAACSWTARPWCPSRDRRRNGQR